MRSIRPLRTAGVWIGLGMGGFVDGILFHQIFQLHNMLSARFYPDTLAKEQLNMVWDGLFHALTWAATAWGIYLLWRAVIQGRSALNSKVFAGSLLLGWGLFNFVEGVIDHHILELHHVVERATGGAELFWDLLFLASGVAMIAGGLLLLRKGQTEVQALAKARVVRAAG